MLFDNVVIDHGAYGVVLTGAKYRILGALINVTQRKPSHIKNDLLRPCVRLGLRAAGLSKAEAAGFADRYHAYLGRGIDLMCDAFIEAPLDQKVKRAVETAGDPTQLKTITELYKDLIPAIERAW